jgi:uncharacterized protein (DUF2147 family)
MKNLFFFAVLAFASINSVFAQTGASADGITGTWMVQDGSAKVKIEKMNGKFVGKIVWLKDPIDKATGKPILDAKNPDKSLRARPQMGLPLLCNFDYDGDNVWTSGTIYDPDSGDTYSCKITYINNSTIEVRGYVGISLFGRTETWKKCPETMATN